MKPVIGFIGLGAMGQAMAANLLRAGYRLRVWNRTPDRAAALVGQGAVAASRPEDAVEPGGLLISSLANDQVLEEVVGPNRALLQRLGQGGIHLSTSTISPATARKLAAGHKEYGVSYLASPVLGRPDAAAAGKVRALLAGPAAAKAQVEPVLRVLAQETFDLGEEPGAANVVKLACNFLLASAIEGMGEAFVLAEKNGIARSSLERVLTRTIFDGAVFGNYCRQIAEERYQPALFKLSLGLKDVRLARDWANVSNMPMPLASLVHDRMLRAVANGRGDLDWTGLAAEASEEAGLRAAPRPSANLR